VIRMNEELSKIIWTRIQEVGTELAGKLPESSRHPKGRNSWAHVANSVKSHYGCSYKELDDSYFDDVMNYITFILLINQ